MLDTETRLGPCASVTTPPTLSAKRPRSIGFFCTSWESYIQTPMRRSLLSTREQAFCRHLDHRDRISGAGPENPTDALHRTASVDKRVFCSAHEDLSPRARGTDDGLGSGQVSEGARRWPKARRVAPRSPSRPRLSRGKGQEPDSYDSLEPASLAPMTFGRRTQKFAITYNVKTAQAPHKTLWAMPARASPRHEAENDDPQHS